MGFDSEYLFLMKNFLFLSWGHPWPTNSGAALRHYGLLQQLNKVYDLELVILAREHLNEEQIKTLSEFSKKIKFVYLKDSGFISKINIFYLMVSEKIPYHSAALKYSLARYSQINTYIKNFPGVIYASMSHWGILVNMTSANWILDQQNADVHFWQVYASQTSNYLIKIAAYLNWILSKHYYKRLYNQVGRVVSVCEEDKQLTLNVEPNLKVDVIENGIDCSTYIPNRTWVPGRYCLLFTGTSAARNVTALRYFLDNIFPKVLSEIPQVELVVGGNFDTKTQMSFRDYKNVSFTGWLEDLKPVFNNSDVYIAPFADTHGSKLKIAEAMAMAMPIVSTRAGIRGFQLVNNQSVLIADNDDQFANQILVLLKDKNKRQEIGDAARQIALATIDWQVLGERLQKIIENQYLNIIDV